MNIFEALALLLAMIIFYLVAKTIVFTVRVFTEHRAMLKRLYA